jgi:drug/metabolite transporter (DMT)-like permease
METKKILAALGYFSTFFAAVLFPLIIFLASDDRAVKVHAKKALLSQLILLIPIPFLIFSAIHEMTGNQSDPPILFITCIIVTIILSIIVAIWNIVKGIQVLSKDSI